MICQECKGRGKAIYYVEIDRNDKIVSLGESEGVCRNCNGSGEQPMTNADRIRAMSDEELAKWLRKIMDCDQCPIGLGCVLDKGCVPSLADWLKQPVKENDNDEKA